MLPRCTAIPVVGESLDVEFEPKCDRVSVRWNSYWQCLLPASV